MSNRLYDILAIIQRQIIPALIACYATIGELLNIPYTTIVLGVMGALNLCFGKILKALSKAYFNKDDNDNNDNEEEE